MQMLTSGNSASSLAPASLLAARLVTAKPCCHIATQHVARTGSQTELLTRSHEHYERQRALETRRTASVQAHSCLL